MSADLIEAAGRGDTDAVLRSLAAGAEIDRRDARGRTAILAATHGNHIATVKALIESGADIDIRDEMKDNPFLYAGAEGLLDIVRLAIAAHADPTSGVDGALWRPSYDANGIFGVEGARLMAVRDLAFKLLGSYAKSPIDVAVPGIGPAAGDTGKDRILDYVATLDMTFGMTITDRVAIGFDAAAYRTSVGAGYGTRGTYSANGQPTKKSTGLISLRPLSNIDPSANPNNSMRTSATSSPDRSTCTSASRSRCTRIRTSR